MTIFRHAAWRRDDEQMAEWVAERKAQPRRPRCATWTSAKPGSRPPSAAAAGSAQANKLSLAAFV
jgi:hypothetical protein